LFCSADGAAASGMAVQAEIKTHVINERNRCFIRGFGWLWFDGRTNRFCGKVTHTRNESTLPFCINGESLDGAGVFKQNGKFAFDLTVIQVEYKGREMALRYSLVI